MILINLLPHREEKRKQRKRAFFASLVACAVAGAVIVALWYSVLQQMTSAQESRNAFLNDEIKRLDAQIKDIATLKSDLDALDARRKAVENLQTDRNVPVHLLTELVRQAPEGIFLTDIKQTGDVVAVRGTAQTNERVSEFLRNTLRNSPWLEKPELVEIKAAPVAQGTRDQRRLFEFSMRVTLKRPQVPTAVAAAASAARPASSPGVAPAISPATSIAPVKSS